MPDIRDALRPAPLLLNHASLFGAPTVKGPILDLACGSGHNGIYLAKKGLRVILCDISDDSLEKAEALAHRAGVNVDLWRVDLEEEGFNPLDKQLLGAILVFRYLHRPLIPCIKKALIPGGLLMYETFTTDQPKFGKPRNPDFLLKPGELRAWFQDWTILHHFEGIQENPTRAVAQMVCRKPAGEKGFPEITGWS